MVKQLEDMLDEFDEAGRARIEAKADAIIQEVEGLSELRKLMEARQTELAERLGIGQDGISRIEHRSDMRLSTLRSYIEGLGGDLEIVAKLPEGRSVSLSRLGAATTDEES